LDYDLLIKNGRLVDGSGMPGYTADLGIRAGRIVAIGRLTGPAGRVIDADGLVVAPGFIDHHTHLDAQMLWDPYGTSEPQHGVTSVIMGNCGLTLAPTKEHDHDALVGCFLRVEAVPRAALAAGVPWGWHTYGQYLDNFESKIGINVGGLVGHMAIRQYVMGEESVERAATADEIQQMKDLVAESLRGGALGFSTNRNSRHMREDGKPVPSRLANDDEIFAIADTLGELNCGIVETVGLGSPANVAWHGEIARRTNHPVMWQSVQPRWTEPTRHEEQLAALATEFANGNRAFALANSIPLVRYFTLADTQVFDEMPTWKNLTFLPPAVRRQAYADPETRAKLQAEWDEPRTINFHRRWDVLQVYKVARAENERYVGASMADVAAARGQDPLNAFLDLSLEEDLQTTFKTSNTRDDSEAMGAILRSPYILIGTSDAGAHVQYGVDFGYSTTLLSLWVRERGVISLEEAVHKLTFQVASIYGLRDRGLVRPGFAADVTIFDPDTVHACEPEWAQDYPAQTRRLIQRSEGVHYTIVNGTVIYENDALTGELPGQVMRGSAYTGSANVMAGASA
jgi:N-acyl-D-aspartate/D-glutamate deacylase